MNHNKGKYLRFSIGLVLLLCMAGCGGNARDNLPIQPSAHFRSHAVPQGTLSDKNIQSIEGAMHRALSDIKGMSDANTRDAATHDLASLQNPLNQNTFVNVFLNADDFVNFVSRDAGLMGQVEGSLDNIDFNKSFLLLVSHPAQGNLAFDDTITRDIDRNMGEGKNDLGLLVKTQSMTLPGVNQGVGYWMNNVFVVDKDGRNKLFVQADDTVTQYRLRSR